MTWLREMLSDNKTGMLSSVRTVMFFSGMTLCLSTLALTAIVFWRVEVVPVLTAFGSSLALMSGLAYGVQKWAGTKEKDQ
jgi:hypothetical protein